MHIPSHQNHQEMLAVPQLVRVDLADSIDGPEPTILIKVSSLSIRYFLRKPSFRLILLALKDRSLAYAVRIDDDLTTPATVWSVAESQRELEALRFLLNSPKSYACLFNELAVNVASSLIRLKFDANAAAIIANANPAPDSLNFRNEVHALLDSKSAGESSASHSVEIAANWVEHHISYISNRGEIREFLVASAEEGSYQEQLGAWLVENLSPRGAVVGAEVEEPGAKPRELADILLSYQYGSFLFESKALAVLARESLPDRNKLKRNIALKVAKALRQLEGGIANLKRGYPIRDKAGRALDVDRLQPAHAIVLLPDSALLHNDPCLNLQVMRDFCARTGGFLHVLDIKELLRMVQSAENISSLGTITTPMMAFDYYLMERAKTAVQTGHLVFEMLLRVDPRPKK